VVPLEPITCSRTMTYSCPRKVNVRGRNALMTIIPPLTKLADIKIHIKKRPSKET
jgi:hypothetical protein